MPGSHPAPNNGGNRSSREKLPEQARVLEDMSGNKVGSKPLPGARAVFTIRGHSPVFQADTSGWSHP